MEMAHIGLYESKSVGLYCVAYVSGFKLYQNGHIDQRRDYRQPCCTQFAAVTTMAIRARAMSVRSSIFIRT